MTVQLTNIASRPTRSVPLFWPWTRNIAVAPLVSGRLVPGILPAPRVASSGMLDEFEAKTPKQLGSQETVPSVA